jgi:MFS family permease
MPISLLVFFTTINIFNYLDRNLVAAVLPNITAEFHLSNTEAGFLESAFVLGYLIFAPIFGYLGDRLSRPRLMALGVFIWSLASIGTAIAPNYTMFVFARVMVGVGEASFGTVAPGYIKDRISEPSKLNSALSIFFVAVPVGSALGWVTGGQFVKHFSWQGAFWFGGVPGILLSIYLLSLKEHRAASEAQGDLREGLRLIAAEPILWFAIGGYALNSFALKGLAVFMSSYGVSIGFELDKITLYFGAILAGTGLFGTVLGGKLASVFAARSETPILSMLRFTGITAFLSVPFLMLAFLTSNRELFLVMSMIAELLIFAGTGPVNSIIVLACPPAFVTLTQGLTILALNFLGSFPAPLVVGKIADKFTLQAGMLSCGIALFFSGLVWTWGGYYKGGKRR